MTAPLDIVTDPKPFEPPPSTAELATVRRGYADGPYGQIHYRAVRPADTRHPPLICLHISPVSGIVYEYFLAEMGKERWTLAPDTPGYGDSAPPPQPDDWECATPSVTIKDYADAMVAFANSLGIREFDIMGYHTGSCIAIEVARLIPDRVRKVILWGITLFTLEEAAEHRKARLTPPQPPSYSEMLLQQVRARERGKVFSDEPTDDREAQIMIDWIRCYSHEQWAPSAVMNYTAQIAGNFDGLKQPILVINATKDDLVEITRRAIPTIAKNPRSRYVERPWHHGALDGHVREMARIVGEFLDLA